MKLIGLSRGQVAKVSDEDYNRLVFYHWHANMCGNGFYACRRALRSRGEQGQKVYMHQMLLLPAVDNRRVKFRNGDTLDLTRENLIT